MVKEKFPTTRNIYLKTMSQLISNVWYTLRQVTDKDLITVLTYITFCCCKKWKFGCFSVSQKKKMPLASGDPVHASVFGVKFLDVHWFSSFSKELTLVENFLNNSHLHVTYCMTSLIEMISCSFGQFLSINIASVLVEPFLQWFVCLSNILLSTAMFNTFNAINHISCIAINSSIY